MKKYLISACILLFSVQINAQSVNHNPGMVETWPSPACMACPGSIWNNESYAIFADGQNADVGLSQNGFCFQSTCFTSRFLFSSHFGFNIPGPATITGISVEVMAFGQSAFDCKDSVIELVIAGTPAGSNLAISTPWPSVAFTRIYGSALNLWGLPLTPPDINDSLFGVIVKPLNLTNVQTQFSVDHISITVFYQLPGGCNLQFQVEQVDPICYGDNNGTATVHSSGGTAPYSFLWMPLGGNDSIANNLPAGNYQLEVTDSLGCIDTAIVNINQPDLDTTLLTLQICPGDSAFIGGEWQTIAGNYSDSLISIQGCDSLIITTLTNYSIPNVTLDLEPDTTCSWFPNDTLSGGLPLGGLFSGIYVIGGLFDHSAPFGFNLVTYTFTSSDGCSAFAIDSIFMDICESVGEPIPLSFAKVYPNPSSSTFIVDSPGLIPKKIMVSNITGAILSEIYPSGPLSVLDLSDYGAGVYCVKIEAENGFRVFRIIRL